MQPAKLGARVSFCFYSILRGMLVAAVCGALAGPAASCAQTVLESPQQTNDRIQAFSLAVQKLSPEYVIGSGDLLSIEVFDVAELTREVRVSQTGTIALPLLPVRLHVSGLNELQAEQKIAEVLEANGLVSHPQVSVSAKEKRSKPITVIGAVGHPMVYQAQRTVTLIEVLSEAGGIANDAGNTVVITRAAPDPVAGGFPGDATSDSGAPAGDENSKKMPREPNAAGAPPPPPIQITVNLGELLESGDPKDNILMEAGDVVTVPHAGIVYVIGAVDRPGGFVLSNDRAQMSALKVLSLAGGLKRTARTDRAVILRKDGNSGQQKEVAVNLKKILERQTEDVPLLPSDILFIPESGRKQAMLKVAEIALAVGTAAAVFRIAR